jgi:serine/threonine protein kinase/Flp pilus assembly protein TadD
MSEIPDAPLRPGPTASAAANASLGRWGVAAAIKDLWRGGQPPDARAALAQHPDLRAEKSVIIDLAYEEYCLREEAGQAADPDEFCQRFPTYQASLRKLILAHRQFGDDSYTVAAGQPVRWPEPGESFLGFNLVSELGRGAFGRVFLATEPALGNRRVAIKVSLEGASEADTLGRFNHPNIVPVHSVQEGPTGLTVVCMPYLGSATLLDILDKTFAGAARPARAHAILDAIRETAPPEEPAADHKPDARLLHGSYIDGVAHLGAQLADGLASIHALGICHLDLKPSNVLITPDGRPMLLDFNLAFDGQVAMSRLGGTLPYMSPEQLRAVNLGTAAGRPEIGPPADVFSLGIILYELLTGAHPFGPVPLKLTLKETYDILMERERRGPRRIRELNRGVDKGLATAIERCLSHDPNDRPRTAAEVASALRRSLSPARRLRRWAASHPFVAVASLLAVVIAGSAAAYAVATREPYAVRRLHQGLKAYADGDYLKAVENLSRTIEIDNENRDARFTRGKAYQALGKFNDALADYRKADEFRAEGRTEACEGYCLNKLVLHEQARALHITAINHGFKKAATYNNLGYTYLVSCRNQAELNLAVENLNTAIRLDPTLQAAFHNRAMAHGKRALDNGLYVPNAGIRDILEAIRLGPPTAELYRDAARLYAVAAQHAQARKVPQLYCLMPANCFGNAARLYVLFGCYDPHWMEPELRYVALALEAGQDPQIFRGATFRDFQNQPEFQAVLQKPVPPTVSTAAIRLVDPRDLPD